MVAVVLTRFACPTQAPACTAEALACDSDKDRAFTSKAEIACIKSVRQKYDTAEAPGANQ